jgi:hypothetical protein
MGGEFIHACKRSSGVLNPRARFSPSRVTSGRVDESYFAGGCHPEVGCHSSAGGPSSNHNYPAKDRAEEESMRKAVFRGVVLVASAALAFGVFAFPREREPRERSIPKAIKKIVRALGDLIIIPIP